MIYSKNKNNIFDKMKKFLLMAAVVILSMTSCENSANKDYKAQGEKLASRLDQLCEQQDDKAVIALEDSIKAMEEEILATGDSAAIADFREALKDARSRSAAFVTGAKVKQGVSNDEAVKSVVESALKGDVDIKAVTSSIDKALEASSKNKKGK